MSVGWLLLGKTEETPAFIEFIETSPLGATATEIERQILATAQFPKTIEPTVELYEKWLIDLRSELRQRK